MASANLGTCVVKNFGKPAPFITVRLSRALTMRLRLGLLIMRLGAMVATFRFKVEKDDL